MPGFNIIETTESATPSSLSSSSGMHYLGSQPGAANMSGGSWDAEGTQNFAGYSDHGDMPQDAEETTYQVHSMEDYSHPKWSLPASAMQRTLSRSSAGSYKNRTIRASAQRTRPQIQTGLCQEPSAVFSAPATALASTGYGMAGGAFSANSAMTSVVQGSFFTGAAAAPSEGLRQYFVYPQGLAAPYDTDAFGYASDLGSALEQPVLHVDPACTQMHMDFEGMPPMSSPLTTDSFSSRRSSPDMGTDDVWSFPATSSPAESHDSALSFGPLPGSDGGMQRALKSDFGDAAQMRPRSGSESDTVRDHPLYTKAIADADGLYHCPWKEKTNCNHKPEKLKCNYDKFVDSHMKPYRCKNPMCENTRFSSTACLLRHEREAHAMHGHGDKPYLCTYEGCERSTPGNGFPRQWNLKDHMKRVHHDDSPPQQAASQQAAATLPSPPRTSGSHAQTKNRKRKKDSLSSQSGSSNPSSRKNSSRISKSQSASALAAAEAESRTQALQAAAAKAQLEQSCQLWNAHQAKLQDIVGHFSQPYAPQTQQQLQEARSVLDALERISQSMVQTQGIDQMGLYGHSQPIG